MKCVICKHGTLAAGTTTMTLEHGGATVVFKHVPAMVCDNCGEEYLDAEVVEGLEARVEQAGRGGVTLVVREYGEAA